MATGRKAAAKKRGAAKKGRSQSQGETLGKKCPDDARKVCRAFNQWAKAMYDWAQEITLKVYGPGGNPGPVNPPPKPPFDM